MLCAANHKLSGCSNLFDSRPLCRCLGVLGGGGGGGGDPALGSVSGTAWGSGLLIVPNSLGFSIFLTKHADDQHLQDITMLQSATAISSQLR